MLVIPQTITVRVTGEVECSGIMYYKTEQIDFKEYVKGVLPNEWLPRWDDEALKAGAIAVKQYAVNMYNSQGYVWDCTWNQVYDPTRRTEQTDRAVEDTWDRWLLGLPYELVIKTYYNANKWGCYTQGPNCMSQEGSQELAEQGYTFEEILFNYYGRNLIYWWNLNKYK